jgi:hypothetical protein
MSEPFNAYQKWLGIPPQHQPPNLYRLLGIELFERDPDTIFNAADRQMAHVRTFQSGQYSEASQQILNEIATAKLCLLKPDRKAAYDAQLQQHLAAVGAVAAAPPSIGAPPTPTAAPPQIQPPVAPPAGGAMLPAETLKLAAVGAVAALLAIAIGMFALGIGPFARVAEDDSPGFHSDRLPDVGFTRDGGEEPDLSSVDLDGQSPPSDPEPGDEPEPPLVDPAGAKDPPKTDPTVKEPTEPGDSGASATAVAVAVAAADAPGPPEPPFDEPPESIAQDPGPVIEAPKVKLAPPDAEIVKPLLDDVRATFEQEYAAARTAAERQQLSVFLRDQSRSVKSNAPLQFVLLEEARRTAVGAGDYSLALRLIDELAGDFSVDTITLKTDAVSEVVKNVREPAVRAELAITTLNLSEEATRSRQFDLAEKLATQARALGGRDNTIRTRALAALNSIKRMQREWQEIEQAIELLAVDPDDPDANALYGRYLCLLEGDWATGLPLLAKSSDAELKAVAVLDLDEPVDPEKRVAVADAWYDLAKSREDHPRLLGRAGRWYALALPDLNNLTRAKVVKRLESLPIFGPAGSVTKETEVHVVGLDNGLILGNTATGLARVVVSRESAPVLLVLVGNSPIKWEVDVLPDVKLAGVVLSGNFRQSVEGLPEGTRVANMTRADGSKLFFHATSRNSSQFADLQAKLRSLSGHGVTSFQGGRRYRGEQFFVGN